MAKTKTKTGETSGKQVWFTYLVLSLQQALRTEAERGLRGVGVTLPQLAVLRTLQHKPGASNAELARYAFVSPQSMGELLATLDRAGLIRRAADPNNARVLRTTLTAEGTRVLAKGFEAAHGAESRLVGALSAAEQQKLRELLERGIAAFAPPRPDDDAER